MAKRRPQAAPWLAIGLAVLLAAGAAAPASGNPIEGEEAKVKSAFLYNFTKFVAWPDAAFPNARAPFVIGVLGNDSFGDAIGALEKKAVNGRPIVVHRVNTMDTLESCQLLFVASSAGPRLPEILRAAHARNILTVGDTRRFASRGCIIELVIDGGRLGFEINFDSARQAGLTISSKLLSLAKVIYREGGK